MVIYIIVQETSSYVVTEEQIEQDELNQHECMLPLMRLLDHMEHNKINPQVPKVDDKTNHDSS